MAFTSTAAAFVGIGPRIMERKDSTTCPTEKAGSTGALITGLVDIVGFTVIFFGATLTDFLTGMLVEPPLACLL